MFQRHKENLQVDLSNELRDSDGCKVGLLRTLVLPANISAFATEPLSALLAIGTFDGQIHVFGRPSVEVTLRLPEPKEARFLQFVSSLFYLICLDAQNTLHIFDLSVYGRPKLLTSARFDQVNSLAVSPSHTHVFLALASGEIRTYDLVCLRKSPFTMPNMWKLYAEKAISNHPDNLLTPEMSIPADLCIHPRALDQLFVGYGGGVLLADLASIFPPKRDTIRAFELVLPPGAPGGYGYGTPDLLRHRRPEVTAFAIHPSAFFFAVGHSDGSIAFWAVDDEDVPLLVRTLDSLDVNIVDHEKLDQVLTNEDGVKEAPIDREPIFKMSWSGYSNSTDPRGGSTTLAILGGLTPNEPAGLTVIQLPAFNPPPPPVPTASSNQPSLSPFMRRAMQASLDPMDSFFYFSKGTVQDYILMPKESPHFNGTFDPLAVVLLSEGQGGTRVAEAYQYPPPAFGMSQTNLTETVTTPDTLAQDLDSTLRSLNEAIDPKRLKLPGMLDESAYGMLGGYLLKVENDSYQVMTRDPPDLGSFLPLLGGVAWSDEAKAHEFKLAKFQPRRLLVNWYQDLHVRFFDISAQLLSGVKPTPLQSSFPNPLPQLTADMKPVLTDPTVKPRLPKDFLNTARIESVTFATEALEAAIVLHTGEVTVFRLSGPQHASNHKIAKDEELVNLEHVPNLTSFSPYFILAPAQGPTTAHAISDIGFLAVAYHENLFIVDMRVPEIILCHEEGLDKAKRGLHLPLHQKHDPVMSLVWTIAPLTESSERNIRLIAMRSSGEYDIYTIVQKGSVWTAIGPVKGEHGVTQPLARGCFVVDAKSGARCRADRSNLSSILSGPPGGVPRVPPFLVTVGSKGAKSIAGIDGKRLGKVEWNAKFGTILDAQIVERMGSHALVIITNRQEAHFYSIPQLESLYTLKLPAVPTSSFTLDETGDFIAWSGPHSSGIITTAHYGTLFDQRRPYELPDIDFAPSRVAVPPHPQRISMGPPSILQLGSWLPFNQGMSGDQIDELLAGPNRPVPQAEKQGWAANLPSRADLTAGASGIASSAAATQSSLYGRLTSAIGERGQALNDLEQRFQALEEGSKSMVAQAKRLATEQSAKSWFGF